MPFPDPTASAFEQGMPLPEAKREDAALPPGGGKWVVPHFTTFAAIINSITRTYRWTFDEALRDSQTNALALRRDPVIMDALRSRQLPVCQLQWHLDAQDDTDERQVQAIKEGEQILKDIPNWQRFLMHLEEAVFYGRYGVQYLMGFDFKGPKGKKRYIVRDYEPVLGDKLVFKYSGQVGILVHTTELNRLDKDTDITDRGRAHFLSPEERECLVVHQYEPEDADFFEGEMAGAIKGVGIRSRLYWFWWLRNQVLAWLMDFLERVGAGGLTIFYYESGSQTSYNEVTNAAQNQSRNNAILFPRYREDVKGGPGIDRIEPSMAGAQLLESLVTQYFDAVIRRYILGQTLSQDTASTGLGSGVAELHADTFARLIKYDAVNLAETLTKDLIAVLWKYNFPGVPTPRFVFDVDKPNAAEVLAAAKDFWEMGGEIDADELRSILGLAKPSPGAAVLTKLPAPSPAGVGALPQGVPIQGTPGPVPQGATGQPAPAGPVPGSPGPYLFKAQGDPVRFAIREDTSVGDLAQRYMRDRGLDHHETPTYDPADPERGRHIADLYEKAVHSPQDPEVRASYDAFKKETADQFRYLQAQGIHMEPWDRPGQPYRTSQEMRGDVTNNRHLYFFTGGEPGELLAEPSGTSVNGQHLTYNDMFRAVHDVFGHARYGNEFGPRGENFAHKVHSLMYSPAARPAMTTETLGQSSWINYGPHSHLPAAQRPFPVQKNTLLKLAASPAQQFFAEGLTKAFGTERAPHFKGLTKTSIANRGRLVSVADVTPEDHGTSLGGKEEIPARPWAKLSFANIALTDPEGNPVGHHEPAAYLRQGSREFLRGLGKFVGHLRDHGYGIHYEADGKHMRFYRKALPSLGYRLLHSDADPERMEYGGHDFWVPNESHTGLPQNIEDAQDLLRFAMNEDPTRHDRVLSEALHKAFGQVPSRHPRRPEVQVIEHNDRALETHYNPASHTVYLQYENVPTSEHPDLGPYDIGNEMRPGSMDFVRRAHALVKDLGQRGYGLEYDTDDDAHREFDRRRMPKLGFRLESSSPYPGRPGAYHDIWRPTPSSASGSEPAEPRRFARQVDIDPGVQETLDKVVSVPEPPSRPGKRPESPIPGIMAKHFEGSIQTRQNPTGVRGHSVSHQGRHLLIDEHPRYKVVYPSFIWEEGGPGETSKKAEGFSDKVAAKVERGSVDFLRRFGNAMREIGRHGYEVAYYADPRHEKFYHRSMPKLGFRLTSSKPAQMDPTLKEEVWEPVGEFQAAAPAAVEWKVIYDECQHP